MSISRKTQKEISWILFLLTCLPICYLLVFGDGGYLRLRYYEEELQRLAQMAVSSTITLLCFEAEGDPQCHRHLLKRLIEERVLNLQEESCR